MSPPPLFFDYCVTSGVGCPDQTDHAMTTMIAIAIHVVLSFNSSFIFPLLYLLCGVVV